jgi:hypothetical protein
MNQTTIAWMICSSPKWMWSVKSTKSLNNSNTFKCKETLKSTQTILNRKVKVERVQVIPTNPIHIKVLTSKFSTLKEGWWVSKTLIPFNLTSPIIGTTTTIKWTCLKTMTPIKKDITQSNTTKENTKKTINYTDRKKESTKKTRN